MVENSPRMLSNITPQLPDMQGLQKISVFSDRFISKMMDGK